MSNLPFPGKQSKVSFSLNSSGTEGDVWVLSSSDDTKCDYGDSMPAYPGVQPGASEVDGASLPSWVVNLSKQLNQDINQFNGYLITANIESKKGNSHKAINLIRDSISPLVNNTFSVYLSGLKWPPADGPVSDSDTTHLVTQNPFDVVPSYPNNGYDFRDAPTGAQVTLYSDRCYKYHTDHKNIIDKSWGFLTNFSISWPLPTPESLVGGPPASSSSLLYSSSSSSGVGED